MYDYDQLSTAELRTLAWEQGFCGAAVASARKEDLIALLKGEKATLETPTLATAAAGLRAAVPAVPVGDSLADVIAAAISGKVSAGVDESVVREIAADAITSHEAETEAARIEQIEQIATEVMWECGSSVRHTSIVMPERAEPIELGEDLIHWQLPQVLAWVRADVPVWLWGLPGGGKTHLGRQIAGILDLEPFVMSIDETTTANKLLGFQNLVSGDFVEGWLYQPFKNGGLAVIDEMDTGNPGIIAALNALLANTHYMFPNGETVERHEDFRVLACANTNGTGAVAGYTARQRLDAATLDRFAVVKFLYDEGLEMQIACGIPSETEPWLPTTAADEDQCFAWVKWVQAVRAMCGNSVLVSPRPSLLGVKALRAGIPADEVASSLVLALCADDTKKRITDRCGDPLKTIAKAKKAVS